MLSPQTLLVARLRKLKPAQLRLLAELGQSTALGLAAARIGMSQPAASRMLAETETLLGLTLHERQGRGLRLTEAGAALAHRATRIQIELFDAAREVAEVATGRAGVVRVGAVTGPALSLVLPALTDLQRISAGFRVEVTVGTSVHLCSELRDGKLDFALARLGAGETQLEARTMASEPLALVVRRGHPILALPRITADDLMQYEWVMGDDDTLLTQTVKARLTELRMPLPQQRVSTSSFLFILALLNQTDSIAPLAAPVVDSFAGNPSVPFVALPIDLGLTVVPFCLVTRKHSQLTPSAQRLADAILAQA